MSAAEKLDTAERHRENLTLFVLSEVLNERRRQHAKWGQQDLLDGTGPGMLEDISTGVTSAADAQRACMERARDGDLTYSDILWEEFAEAMEESDPARLRAELLQVAAVAVQWVEAIDRRKQGGA